MLAIFIARSVDGLTAGDIAVANAYIADIATDGRAQSRFRKMGVAGNLGFILGPALAGALAQTSLGLDPADLHGAGNFGCGTLAHLVFPPGVASAPSNYRARQKSHGCFSPGNPNAPAAATGKREFAPRWRSIKFHYFLQFTFVFFLAFSLFVVAMPLYATESLHWSIAEIGIFFSILFGRHRDYRRTDYFLVQYAHERGAAYDMGHLYRHFKLFLAA